MEHSVEDRFIPSSRNGLKIAITIYKPNKVTKPVPTIVMGHGIGAIKSAGLAPFASRFASEGYAAITFDYLSFGQSEGHPRDVLNVQHELQDFKDVIAWARAPEQGAWVDAARVVAWGTSFGGMHTTALLAQQAEGHDDGVVLAAAITQCPLVDGLAGVLQAPLGRTLRLLPTVVGDFAISYLAPARAPWYVDLTSDGSKPALLASREVMEGIERLRPPNVEEEWSNRIAGRSILNFMFARPLRHIHKSTRPYLIVLPTWDNQASLSAAEECVRRAPLGEGLRVEGGHFDVYEGGIGFEKNIQGQVDFLRRVVGPVQ